MYLEVKAVQHILDTVTHFSVETVFDAHGARYRNSGDGLWIAFLSTCVLIINNYPSWLCTDQGPILVSERRNHLTDMNWIQLRLSEVLAHVLVRICITNSFRWYTKIQFVHPFTILPHILRVAVNAIYHTLEVFAPSRDVSRLLPHYPILKSALPKPERNYWGNQNCNCWIDFDHLCKQSSRSSDKEHVTCGRLNL